LGSGTYVINKNGTIVGASGTSFAAPLVAGLATGLWQAFPDKTASEILAALRMSASQAGAPDNSMGYGIPSYLRVHNYLEATTATDWYAAYPNPVADNYLTVKIYDAGNNKDVSIRLFDAQGKQIADDVIGISWRQNEALLEVSGLYPGIYIVNLRSQQHFSRFKIVKL
ncbi:MAG TPA: T9SS type A sorting domain-containing protein, partial [Flammeovirgaceae bacterium]|nr:T9SS type A sorting domain-containing protein [Flammeovirgaceae bacterium]